LKKKNSQIFSDPQINLENDELKNFEFQFNRTKREKESLASLD
jgi:hypothetical protein